MKPIIGVTPSIQDEHRYTVTEDTIQAVVQAGGIPVILPHVPQEEQADKITATIDGLLLSGGGDIDPTLFGEEPHPHLGLITPERDAYELMLSRRMLAQNKPILAICRGCQILNIATGGDMYQDIYDQKQEQLLQHSQKAPRSHGSHYIQVEKGTLLEQIVGRERYKVNSYHHQAVREMGEHFQICARSSDGVIEAFESTDHSFVLAVQWHPESMVKVGDEPSLKLFEAFVEKSKKQSNVVS